MAFLERCEAEDGWFTVGHGTGAIDFVRDSERDALRARVRELLAIEALRNPERHSKTIDWLLRCLDHPLTRGDAATELAAQGCRGFDPDEPDYGTFRDAMTKTQRARLLEILVAEGAPIDAPMRRLLPLVHDLADARLLGLLKEEFRVRGVSLWPAELAGRIASLSNGETKLLAAELSELIEKANGLVKRITS